MCGRSVKLALLVLLLAPTQALAKKHNLTSGIPFGIGLLAGVEQRQSSDFVTGTPTAASGYSNYFGFAPYYDLINVVFQGYLAYHFYPDLSGAGTDATGAFTEGSQAGNFSYGVRILLAPFIAKNGESRAYIVLGAGLASVKAKNTRTYTASGTSFTERVSGTGMELTAGAGVEFFLLQNYSVQLEGGYVQRNVDKFKYATDNDSSGTARTNGDEVVNLGGGKKAFHVYGVYGQLALNLNF